MDVACTDKRNTRWQITAIPMRNALAPNPLLGYVFRAQSTETGAEPFYGNNDGGFYQTAEAAISAGQEYVERRS
jgi:hypothetical protein